MTAQQRPRNGPDPFEDILEPHRREIQLHCYRMLGSIHDAEDATQETFLRAWRSRDGFEARGSFRGWLFRIATNVCLQLLGRRRNARRVLSESATPAGSFEPLGQAAASVAWLDPYPDALVEGIVDLTPGPEKQVEARDSIRLAFVALIQQLPPRQRAALLLHDVLGMSAAETGAILDASVPAVNSALQRARATLRRLDPGPGPSPTSTVAQRRLLDRYVAAWEATDVDRFVGLLREDAAWKMPPWREWYVGRATIAEFLSWVWRPDRGVRERLAPTAANGQPAFAHYRWRPGGAGWQPFAIQVLELDDHGVSSIVNFVDPALFAPFGLDGAPPDRPRVPTIPTDESKAPR